MGLSLSALLNIRHRALRSLIPAQRLQSFQSGSNVRSSYRKVYRRYLAECGCGRTSATSPTPYPIPAIERVTLGQAGAGRLHHAVERRDRQLCRQ